MRQIIVIDPVFFQAVFPQLLSHIIRNTAFRTDKIKGIPRHLRHRDAVPQIFHFIEASRPVFHGKQFFQHLDLTVEIIYNFVVNNEREDLPQIIFIKTKFLKHLSSSPTEIKLVQIYDTGNALTKC